jgi:hypothetical protein
MLKGDGQRKNKKSFKRVGRAVEDNLHERSRRR